MAQWVEKKELFIGMSAKDFLMVIKLWLIVLLTAQLFAHKIEA